MGKFRSKLKGQSKGKRWPKGQSSSSNPETKKYRNQAVSRFFQENLGPSNLTTNAIQKHDAQQTYVVPKIPEKAPEPMEDEQSCYTNESSFHTIKTFASDWTECSNMSFNRFLNVFRSDSALHKEMLAILAAVTEVIKENGGSETPTEYFASLVTTLEQITSQAEVNEVQLSAALSLLNMGIKTVPVPVLRTQFNTIAGLLMTVLKDYADSDNNVIIKSVFGVLAVVLKNQELAIWQNSQTLAIFDTVLNPFTLHVKPKWRKSAQHAVASTLAAEIFINEHNFNPAADRVAEFCLETLEACLGSNSSSTVLVSSVQAGQTTILHTLGLLKDSIVHFNKIHIKKCCEVILKLMSLNYPIVTSCGLQVLHSLFSAQKAVVPSKLNGQLISALYEYQPSSADVQPTLAWLTVMQQAHVHLADVDLEMCCKALPKVFQVITQLWLSQKPDIVLGATRALEILFKDAMSQICADEQVLQNNQNQITKCFLNIELGLGYQYNHAWNQVLHITSVMFEVCGGSCSKLLQTSLKTLSELRDSYKFTYNNELEHAVGAAVRSMGPEAVLDVISLKKDNGDLNLDRSWLLPVLHQNINHSTLEYFTREILPLAMACQRRSVELAAKNDGIGGHSAELLHLQLWHLLPRFSNRASDISAEFKNLAKILGMAISERKELRISAMAALRKLISSAKQSENQEDLKELARFDKNYLPILFNVYTTKPLGSDEEGQRLAAIDTIKMYLSIARPELTQQLFDNALDRMMAICEPDDFFVKESILDLVKALLPYQPISNIHKLYEVQVKNLPEIRNNKEQKKAYRLLEEICGSSSENCQQFLKENRKSIQSVLKKSLEVSAVSSRGARLRCLNFLIKSQPQLTHESKLISSSIPEAVLAFKDINEKCRIAAYKLLNTIGEILLNRNETEKFLQMVVAGLGGTVELMTATIMALTSILHDFNGSLGQQNIAVLLENILQLLTSPSREIVGACLTFLKAYMYSMPTPLTAANLPAIVKGICSIKPDAQRHFRLKVRHILEKLVRKFGCDSILPYVPNSDNIMHKRLRNIRKLNNQKKKQRGKEKDSDSGSDEEFAVKRRAKTMEEILADSDSDDFDDSKPEEPRKLQKKYSTFIEEDADCIVDFQDPSVVSKITTTKPQNGDAVRSSAAGEAVKDRGFKTASDGRIIIDDGSDSAEESGKRKKKSFLPFGNNSDDDDDSDDDSDHLSKAETDVLRDQKRKRSDASSIASSFQSKSKYQPGGSGIHRKIGSSAGSVKSNFGSEYRGKKAAGDVKKKGKVDPYAYVPLQRSSLNKRKKLKQAGQFRNLIGAAKAGSKKGMKARRKK